MACMAALVGASVAIGAPSAALSRSSASSVICSSSSSFNPVFLRNRSFHGTTVRLGATKPGLTFSSFVILCWEPPAQMMMAFSSIILSMVAYCILRCSLVSNIPPPPPPTTHTKSFGFREFFRNRYDIEALSHIFFILAFLVNLSNVFLPSETFCSNICIYIFVAEILSDFCRKFLYELHLVFGGLCCMYGRSSIGPFTFCNTRGVRSYTQSDVARPLDHGVVSRKVTSNL
jgi:hypothetical protein